MSRDGAIALEPRPYCIDHPVTDERTWLRTLDEARALARDIAASTQRTVAIRVFIGNTLRIYQICNP